MRALALFTGGLDSLLSVRLIQDQGIEVVGLYVATALCARNEAVVATRAGALGIELEIIELAGPYCRLVRAPRFGRLVRAAPCVDCRIAMFAQARELLAKCGASFVTSGEVVGQRPRTAVRDLEVVAHHAGLAELLVRPLSARLLPLTEPEKCGWIDRTRLRAFEGKSRKTQLALARELGLGDAPPARPDCPLLTEPLSTRLHEVLAEAGPTPWLLPLLAIGRHERIDAQTRIIVSRNHVEGEELTAAARAHDAGICSLAIPRGFAGPTALIVGPAAPAACRRATELVRRYGRPSGASGEQVQIQSMLRR
jgi:hypothetical protein